jgi:hypothetical protein
MNGRNWRKASYSSENGGECVEVGDGVRSVVVRDTKERNLRNTRTVLTVPSAAWSDFLKSVR